MGNDYFSERLVVCGRSWGGGYGATSHLAVIKPGSIILLPHTYFILRRGQLKGRERRLSEGVLIDEGRLKGSLYRYILVTRVWPMLAVFLLGGRGVFTFLSS